MARPKKEVVMVEDSNAKIEVLSDIIAKLMDKMEELENKVNTLQKNKLEPKGLSINRTEQFNNEQPSTPHEERSMGMNFDDKLQSMRNAIAILPPNMTIAGKHTRENVQAIVGFLVDENMLDRAYQGIKHDA
jgi:hypothetical protein